MKNWLSAARPKTLSASLAPILVATALVWSARGECVWWISVLALLCSLCIQVATNLINDAKDFEKGADQPDRLGPKRVTAAGDFSPSQVQKLAFGFFAAALVLGIPLVVQGGVPIFLVGLASLLFGYLYTAGPYPLAYYGLGDIFVILFFGIVAVAGLVFLQAGQILPGTWLAGLQVGLLCASLIAINNLRDLQLDARAGKRTLGVMLGRDLYLHWIAFLFFAPMLFQIGFFLKTHRWEELLPISVLPLVLLVLRFLFLNLPSAAYNRQLARASAIHLIFSVLLALSYIL